MFSFLIVKNTCKEVNEMLNQATFSEIISSLNRISSQGFNHNNDNFVESIGLTQNDDEIITKTILLVHELSNSWSEFFENVSEIAKYLEDPIVKSYFIYEAGRIMGVIQTGRKKDEECMQAVKEAYKQGLKEGLSLAKD
jgi:hypothetical protein